MFITPIYTVYVIGADKPRPVKIGYAKNARDRLAALQTGSPKELGVWYEANNLTRDEARRVEKAVHKALKPKSVRGEWFDVTLDEAVEAIWSRIDGRVYSARMLMRFDTRAFITPEKREKIREVAFRTMDSNALR